MKRSREGQLSFNCSGITTESKIAKITAWNEEQKSHLTAENVVIIKNCYVSQRDTSTFVQVHNETKVSYCVFLLIKILQTYNNS